MEGMTVIVPTLNREDYILKTIQMLLNQTFGCSYEILIIDQSDTENNEIKKWSEETNSIIKYYHCTEFRGLPEARNFGVSKAAYDYILFLDDDIELGSNLLSEHYKYLKDPNVGVVAGGITEKFRKDVDVKKVGFFDYVRAMPYRGYHMDKSGYVDHGGGGNYSIKKCVFNEVGGVDEYLNYGAALNEETEICIRVKKAGYKIYFNYHAHIIHLAAESGGCTVMNQRKYVQSMVHNKALVITRHLKWYYKITAVLYLLRSVTSFVVRNYNFSFYIDFFSAYKLGRKKGKLIPKNSFNKNT